MRTGSSACHSTASTATISLARSRANWSTGASGRAWAIRDGGAKRWASMAARCPRTCSWLSADNEGAPTASCGAGGRALEDDAPAEHPRSRARGITGRSRRAHLRGFQNANAPLSLPELRPPSTPERPPMTPTHGFTLLREQKVAEINALARYYRHGATGAELLSLINNDENKVFGVSFATPPKDSTGVAHILEHSVLCGSRKYPIKEPFVELMKSSLNTFLNAMTFPDKTCYPVASQNAQDFYNLIDVYLDAVFHPRLTPQIFQQEGWHYELDTPDAPLVYKGVVFNEMKGNYSSPDSMLRELSQRSLYPDITYGLDSGGDPRHIPDLSYEELKAFHQRHYHPSNAKFFFYGDDDPDERLRLIGARLAEFSGIAVDAEVPLQPRFAAPKRLTRTYAAGNEDAQGAKEAPKETMLTVNWMFDEPVDIEAALAFDILEHILIGTPAAPLYKALIDSGLGEALAGTGLDDGLRQPMFSIGLKGIDAADADKVERLITDTIFGLAEKGIDPPTLEAALNTVEFHLRENNTGAFPRGIVFMLRSLRTWLHGRDPLSPLAFET